MPSRVRVNSSVFFKRKLFVNTPERPQTCLKRESASFGYVKMLYLLFGACLNAGESLGGAEATFGLFNVRLSDDGKR